MEMRNDISSTKEMVISKNIEAGAKPRLKSMINFALEYCQY